MRTHQQCACLLTDYYIHYRVLYLPKYIKTTMYTEVIRMKPDCVCARAHTRVKVNLCTLCDTPLSALFMLCESLGAFRRSVSSLCTHTEPCARAHTHHVKNITITPTQYKSHLSINTVTFHTQLITLTARIIQNNII